MITYNVISKMEGTSNLDGTVNIAFGDTAIIKNLYIEDVNSLYTIVKHFMKYKKSIKSKITEKK